MSQAPSREELTAFMRSLGYALDGQDRWVNPNIRMVAPDPRLLYGLPRAAVRDFHDPELWESPDLGEDPPPLDASTRALLEGLDLEWDPQLGAWLLIGEVWMTPAQLDALGAAQVRARVAGFRELRAGWRSQAQLVLFGMLFMVVWVLTGWRFGAGLYLVGMLGIALVTWICRPTRIPKDVWAGLSPELLDERVEVGVRTLGPGWEELGRELRALLVDESTLHLRTLERTIRLSAFRRRFTPEALGAILEALSPLEEEEDEG